MKTCLDEQTNIIQIFEEKSQKQETEYNKPTYHAIMQQIHYIKDVCSFLPLLNQNHTGIADKRSQECNMNFLRDE